MIVVLQRVKSATVFIDKEIINSINWGYLLLVAINSNDTIKDVKYLAEKIPLLRIFPDKNNKMNNSILDIKGEILVVSQFTLYGDFSRGRRPNFLNAAKSSLANELYLSFCNCLSKKIIVKKGVFGENMDIQLINDGPVTFILDSNNIKKSSNN